MRNKTSFAALLAVSVSTSSLAFAGSNGYYSQQAPELLPPSPVAGQCYARVKIPAQYDVGSAGVLVEDSYQTVQVSQPQLVTRQENILVKEASTRYEVTQPQYQTVSEQVLISPAYDKLSVTPPTFKSVQERIATSAPHLVWKKGNPGRLIAQGYTIHGTANGGVGGQGFTSTSQYGASGGEQCGQTCEIWCLVEEPGESTSYLRKVLDQPARIKRTPVQAKYQTVSKQVLSQPGSVREIPIPAEYRSLTVSDLVSPAREDYVTVPPKYGSVQTKQLIAPERYEWRQVVCKPGTGSIKQSHEYSSSHHSGSSYASGSSHSSYSSTQSHHNSYNGTSSSSYGSGAISSAEPATTSHTTTQTGGTYYYGTERPVRAPHRSGR